MEQQNYKLDTVFNKVVAFLNFSDINGMRCHICDTCAYRKAILNAIFSLAFLSPFLLIHGAWRLINKNYDSYENKYRFFHLVGQTLILSIASIVYVSILVDNTEDYVLNIKDFIIGYTLIIPTIALAIFLVIGLFTGVSELWDRILPNGIIIRNRSESPVVKAFKDLKDRVCSPIKWN